MMGGGGEAGGSPSKDKGVRLAGKVVEVLPAIIGSVLGAILSFLGKVVVFVAEHTWMLLVFTARLVSVWLMQRVWN